MGANKKIKVERLPHREALKLLEEKVGAETLDTHPDIRKLAEDVAKECAGLQIALITIGRAMASKKTLAEWKHVIDRLRRSAAFVFQGVGKEMFPRLKFSYDCLPDEMVRSCFLYCCLYLEDFLIEKDELIHCWIGEGFLDEPTSLSSVRNQEHYIIGSLIDACLLEEEGNDLVKMHDVIRDMTLWKACEPETEIFFLKPRAYLKEQPVAEKWENVTRVLLIGNQIESLTEILACPNLRTLFLGRNKWKMTVNDFFKFMPILKVLDLSRNIYLEELPHGFSKLVSLQHLNLSYTGIRQLPIELGGLEKLKYLNLEFTSNLRCIPRQLISSFSQLQVLKLYGSTFRDDEWLVEEMEQLKYLNVLTITFKSASMLERALGSHKFRGCNVEAVRFTDFKSSRLNILSLANPKHLYALQLGDCNDLEEVKIEHSRITSAGCFHSLRLVRLFECSKLRDASWVVFAPRLEDLLICGCKDLEEILSEEKLGEVAAELNGNSNLFSKLEHMKTIYWDALPFPRLKKIRIRKCPRLKRLPLNSDSTKGHKTVIQGHEEWWKEVEWEDESTRIAFLHSS